MIVELGESWPRCSGVVDFLNVELSEKLKEIALSKKNKFAVHHSPNFFCYKKLQKIGRMATQFNFTIEKSTPGHQFKITGKEHLKTGHNSRVL